MTEAREQTAGGLCQDTVGSGDLVGELVERRGVDDPAATGTGVRHGHGHTVGGAHRPDGVVDERVQSGHVLDTGGVQRGEVAAADGGAVAGAQGDLGGHVPGPAVAELPRAAHPLGDVRGPLAGPAEDRTQRLPDRVGQDRPERRVAAGQARDLIGERREVGLGRAVDRTQAQLGAQVQQQLVAAGGDAVAQRLDRVARHDLLGTDLGAQRHQDAGGLGGAELQIVRAGYTGCGGRGGRRV